MYDKHTHSVPDRIVSLSKPFIRPIVRGKAGKPVEFGAKLDISVSDGWTRLEVLSFVAYNESTNLRIWWNDADCVQVITRVGYWRIRFTGIEKTLPIVSFITFDFQAQHWDGQRRMMCTTINRTIWMNVNA